MSKSISTYSLITNEYTAAAGVIGNGKMALLNQDTNGKVIQLD